MSLDKNQDTIYESAPQEGRGDIISELLTTFLAFAVIKADNRKKEWLVTEEWNR